MNVRNVQYEAGVDYAPSWFIKKLSAPEGHFFTCSTISAVVACFASIQGLRLKSNTPGSPRTQLPACWHSEGLQITVTSPFECFIVISFMPNFYRMRPMTNSSI